MEKLSSLISAESLETMRKFAMEVPEGPIVEVGVFMGGSAFVLQEVADERGLQLYLYDTFSGIPYKRDIDSHQIGDFGNGLSYEEAQDAFPRAFVTRCVFPKCDGIPDKISFVHLDVDQWQSYREALDCLIPRMRIGGMILCDDYCLGGAREAIDETPGNKQLLQDGRVLFRF